MSEFSIEVVGAEEVAADFRRAAATVDMRLAADMQQVVSKMEDDYRRGIHRRSGQTRAGVGSEVRLGAGEVEGAVYNDWIDAIWHEYGGGRSAPNPAMKLAVDSNLPSWVERATRRAGEV